MPVASVLITQSHSNHNVTRIKNYTTLVGLCAHADNIYIDAVDLRRENCPAGEVEVILLVPSYCSKSIHASFTGPPQSFWDCSTGLRVEPGWNPSDRQPAVRQVCTAACDGRSDGRLERDDVCAFDQVFVLPVDQRVPLVKVLV